MKSTFWKNFKIVLTLFLTALGAKLVTILSGQFPEDWLTWRTVILACCVPALQFIYDQIKSGDSSDWGKVSGWQWFKILSTFGIAFIPFIINWSSEGAYPNIWAVWRSAIQISAIPVINFLLTITQNSEGKLLKKEG